MLQSKEALWDIEYGPGPQRSVTHRHDVEFIKCYVLRDKDGSRIAWCPRCGGRTLLEHPMSDAPGL